MADREKLVVTETKDIQAIGDKGAKKLAFKAKNTEGKELAYFTWRKELFSHITVDSELDAEVETSTREYEGNTYTDRKVNQLFIDGQPVSRSSSGDGKWRSKSPEEMELSRRSFALAYAKDLVVAGKIEIGDLLNQATELEKFMVGEKPEQKAQEDVGKPAPKKQRPQSMGEVTQGELTRGGMLTTVEGHLESLYGKKNMTDERKAWMADITSDYRGVSLLGENELPQAYRKALEEISSG